LLIPSNQSINKNIMSDIAIIGSGPAGYSAALYCGRAGFTPILFSGSQLGGQLITTTEVENYLGMDGVNGFDMTDIFQKHAVKYGTKIIEDSIIHIEQKNQEFMITGATQQKYSFRAVIIATGASAKRLNLPSEDKLWNKGISACAVCDGALPMFRKKPVAVIGGGDTAMEEAIFLSRFASKVYVIHRRNIFRASKIMQERLFQLKNVEILYDTQVLDAIGVDDRVSGIKLTSSSEGKTYELPVNGIFYAIGHTPNTDFLKNLDILDANGYIITGHDKAVTATKVPGLFACGDVQDYRYKQVATAVGSGCQAALDVVEYLH
jgi:thioredoxin reductase (NADPH)